MLLCLICLAFNLSFQFSPLGFVLGRGGHGRKLAEHSVEDYDVGQYAEVVLLVTKIFADLFEQLLRYLNGLLNLFASGPVHLDEDVLQSDLDVAWRG